MADDMSFEQVFSDVFAIPVLSVQDDLLLRDVPNWDSMSHMMMIMHLEEAFHVQLTGDQIADIRSVGDCRLALRAQGATI